MPKIWFITGCSKGFGRKLTEELLKTTDAYVVATARRPESLIDLQKEYKDRLLTLSLDVTLQDEITTGVQQALARFSRIDVLVNNAGYGIGGALEECAMEHIRNIFDTNVFGLMAMTKAVLPIMRSQGCGHILNLSSIAGLVAMPGAGLYNSTKFAVEGLSEALAAEVSGFGIKVTIIEPGPFRTDFAGHSLVMSLEHPAYKESLAFQTRTYLQEIHETQPGDPVKAAKIMIELVAMENPPLRMPLGNSAMDRIHQRIKTQNEEFAKFETLARSADYDEAL